MAAGTLTYDQIMLQLKQQQYKPVYLLYGDEPYYIDKVTDYIEENVLDEAGKSFDQVVLYGRDLAEAGIGEAVMQARGFAMMGGYKVVIVREAQMIKKWQALEQYIAAPQPQSILVIACKSGSAPKVPASPHVAVMQSTPLRDYQVAGWITRYIDEWNKSQAAQAKEDRVTIDPKVTQILADNLGTNLQQIVLSLEKLVNGRPAGVNVIDAALVERNIGISKDYNNFELEEALATRNAKKAYEIINYYEKNPKANPTVVTVSVLFGYFSKILIYRTLAGKSQDELLAALGTKSPLRVKKIGDASRYYTTAACVNIISWIRECDVKSKGMGSRQEASALLRELIYKILNS